MGARERGAHSPKNLKPPGCAAPPALLPQLLSLQLPLPPLELSQLGATTPVACCCGVLPRPSVSSVSSARRRPAPVPAMGHVQFRNAFHDGDVTKPARAPRAHQECAAGQCACAQCGAPRHRCSRL